MPAAKDEQLRVERSLGTDMWRSRSGSLSMIMSMGGVRAEGETRRDMHSSWFSTLFSIASAGRPKTARHTWVWTDMSAGRKRISRFGVFEEDSARQTMSSRTRAPTRYPRVLSLRAMNERRKRERCSGPAFEIVYAADALLCVLDHLGEEECKGRCGYLCRAGLVEAAVINVGSEGRFVRGGRRCGREGESG